MLKPYDLLENVLIDIEEGIRKSINADILAQKYSLSKRHLERLFELVYKQPLSGYIRSRRLTASLVDLLKTNSKILSIALDFGFDYEQSYIRAFKREFGVSPGEFRKTGYLTREKLLLYIFDRHKFPNSLYIAYFLERLL